MGVRTTLSSKRSLHGVGGVRSVRVADEFCRICTGKELKLHNEIQIKCVILLTHSVTVLHLSPYHSLQEAYPKVKHSEVGVLLAPVAEDLRVDERCEHLRKGIRNSESAVRQVDTSIE